MNLRSMMKVLTQPNPPNPQNLFKDTGVIKFIQDERQFETAQRIQFLIQIYNWNVFFSKDKTPPLQFLPQGITPARVGEVYNSTNRVLINFMFEYYNHHYRDLDDERNRRGASILYLMKDICELLSGWITLKGLFNYGKRNECNLETHVLEQMSLTSPVFNWLIGTLEGLYDENKGFINRLYGNPPSADAYVFNSFRNVADRMQLNMNLFPGVETRAAKDKQSKLDTTNRLIALFKTENLNYDPLEAEDESSKFALTLFGKIGLLYVILNEGLTASEGNKIIYNRTTGRAVLVDDRFRYPIYDLGNGRLLPSTDKNVDTFLSNPSENELLSNHCKRLAGTMPPQIGQQEIESVQKRIQTLKDYMMKKRATISKIRTRKLAMRYPTDNPDEEEIPRFATVDEKEILEEMRRGGKRRNTKRKKMKRHTLKRNTNKRNTKSRRR